MADHDISVEIPFMDDGIKDSSVDDLAPSDLFELKSKLEDELRILEKARLTAQLEENTGTITDLQESLCKLKDQLVEESNKLSLQELIIKRLEMHELLCPVLFKEDKDTRESKIVANSLGELPMASEIMRIQKEIDGLQKIFDSIKIENLKIKCENMTIVEKLKTHKEKASSMSNELTKHIVYPGLKSEMDTRMKSLNIFKNIIPRLFVGARSSDPHLQDLVLQCGEPFRI